MHETATELLHGQKALFPPLANCNHPLKCIVAKLTTRENREELEHSNIKTIGNLSRLDKADGGASHGQEGKSVTNTRSRLTKFWKNNRPRLKDTQQIQNR